MALTPAQQKAREGKITASFLPNLMAGDNAEIFDKWLELIGDPEWKAKDFSREWAPSWGAYGEKFILDWHEVTCGQPITRRGEFVQHPTRSFVGATLDGFRAADDTVLDCKVSGAFLKIENILNFYAPQLICQRACLQCKRAALLLVHGASEPREFELEVEVDSDYERRMWERVEEFWDCVERLIQPVQFPKVTPASKWTEIDLVTDSAGYNWAPEMRARLNEWALKKPTADEFAEAVKTIKTLLPNDCGKLFFGSVSVKRNRIGSITIVQE